MYYPDRDDCPVGGYGYLILLFICVERQVQMWVKFVRRQSLEGFPEVRVSRIPNPKVSKQLARHVVQKPVGRVLSRQRVTPYARLFITTLLRALADWLADSPGPKRASHICSCNRVCGVCIEGGPGLSPLNNRIKNDNPKIRRHQRSPARDCRPN